MSLDTPNANDFDPSLGAALASIVETAINKALQYDPGTRAALKNINGTCLALECTAPHTQLFFLAVDEFLHVNSYHDSENHSKTDKGAETEKERIAATGIETKIRGSLPDLLALVFNPKHNLADSGIEIIGKTSLLVEYQRIFRNLDIDWEEPLNDQLGVLPGHQVATTIRTIQQQIKQTFATTKENLPDYLIDELQIIPGKTELNEFADRVDELRSDTERLAARLAKLNSQIQTNKEM